MTPGASTAELEDRVSLIDGMTFDHSRVLHADIEGSVGGLLHAALRRTLDTLGALTLLVLSSPLLLAIAVSVRISSPGPVFYGSERWGRGGRRFRMWKFRTMVDSADTLLQGDTHLNRRFQGDQKLKNDPRTTAVGKVLRRFSLDELPQIWNVLVGEMSLVGPRPKLIEEAERYGPAIFPVLSVSPGLTGLWQISGRNDTTYEERIGLDLEYVQRQSILLDAQILMRTAATVVSGRGAY